MISVAYYLQKKKNELDRSDERFLLLLIYFA